MICGFFLAPAGTSGVKGLRASEGYSLSSVQNTHPAWCLIHALRELYLLQLENKRIELFIIPPASLTLGQQLLSQPGNTSLEQPLLAIDKLLKGLATVKIIPCNKGPFHDAMENKLQQLSRTNSNELTTFDFPSAVDHLITPPPPEDPF